MNRAGMFAEITIFWKGFGARFARILVERKVGETRRIA
jgi:hypothetical protein